MRFKIVYYAEPTNENEPPKSKADNGIRVLIKRIYFGQMGWLQSSSLTE